MITARLNRLIKAYRLAKKLVGDANRGRALPGAALRWCHKIRQAIKAELMVVEAVIRPERLLRLHPQVTHANVIPGAGRHETRPAV